MLPPLVLFVFVVVRAVGREVFGNPREISTMKFLLSIPSNLIFSLSLCPTTKERDLLLPGPNADFSEMNSILFAKSNLMGRFSTSSLSFFSTVMNSVLKGTSRRLSKLLETCNTTKSSFSVDNET